jgi:carbon storage regulator
MEENVMLVLSRKVGEEIRIDGQIKVRIVKISGNRVRIGIDAPDDVQIIRQELNEWNDSSVGTPQSTELTIDQTCAFAFN